MSLNVILTLNFAIHKLKVHKISNKSYWLFYFEIMFNIEKAHFIMDEMVMNGCIVETNKTNILTPIRLMDKLG